MKLSQAITRAAYVADRALRTTFPTDFDKRCLYAAFGLHSSVQQMGCRSNIVAGDFLALCVAKNRAGYSLQGYQRSEGHFAHYWCEVEGRIVDLGPVYLPVSSRYEAAPAPMSAWPLDTELPPYLRYRARERYSENAELFDIPEITERMARYLEACRQKLNALKGQPSFKPWLLSGPKSVETAARKGSIWAEGAQLFERSCNRDELPF